MSGETSERIEGCKRWSLMRNERGMTEVLPWSLRRVVMQAAMKLTLCCALGWVAMPLLLWWANAVAKVELDQGVFRYQDSW
ncbi:hypothetical protein H257_03315 [Aphanomyces astaci]|uniref:Uncharacterized protein n=1 Tax=Aphanomyces astaci TaxID=112090 RepID=W4H308_APHAT|nr:hypothetical protein H257_03315 [Aphanomyces astaci]ETV85609.1 hypothetical protein H257_03315 [Aphanomyces astaci]|eukprot:XP_009825627.1 hypothetical protein H257_03315 [Aphanomyces astaci]